MISPQWFSPLIAAVAAFAAVWVSRSRGPLERARRGRIAGASLAAGGALWFWGALCASPVAMLPRGQALLGLTVSVVSLLQWSTLSRRILEARDGIIGILLFGAIMVLYSAVQCGVCIAAVVVISIVLGVFLRYETRDHVGDPRRTGRFGAFLAAHLIALSGLLCFTGYVAVRAAATDQSWWMVMEQIGRSDRVFDRCALGAILVASLCELGVFPFHSWALAFLAAPRTNFLVPSLAVAGGMGLFMRFAFPLCHLQEGIRSVLQWVGAISLGYMALLLFAERRLKRISSLLYLSHVSLIVIGVSVSGTSLDVGVQLDQVNVLLATSGLLFVAGVLTARLGTEGVTTPTGLSGSFPELGVCFLVCSLSLVGFPGTVGFIVEELLLQGMAHNYALLSVTAIAIALNGYCAFKLFGKVFCGAHQIPAEPALHLTEKEKWVVYGILALLIGNGLVPRFVVSMLVE